jgi:hypothetical protein
MPAVLSAAKSYSERLFRYQRIDRLDRIAADRALCCTAAREQVSTSPRRSTCCTRSPAGTRTSCRRTARRPGITRRTSPIAPADVLVAAPEAEAELAVGFFGARYERATPAEREYMRTDGHAGADAGPDAEADTPVATADVAKASPAARPRCPRPATR